MKNLILCLGILLCSVAVRSQNVGNVGIGTTAPGAKLEVAGGVKISDSINIGGQVRIMSGTPGAGKVLTSDAMGLASWTTPSTSTHTIGESYGGGIVFYITPNAMHGLIAETVDQSTSSNWYKAQDNISIAANHSSTGINFTDWRLPTKNELNLLYSQRAVVGGFANYYYWSSTEYDFNFAWTQDFYDGYQYNFFKDSTFYVRAVRAF